MTTADERSRAVLQTRQFLEVLRTCEGVPESIRREAGRLLRHFPDAGHIRVAAVAFPHVWSCGDEVPSSAPSYIELLSRARQCEEAARGDEKT